MLEDMGYDVILSENGEQAIDIFKQNFSKIDVVIMDMIMPKQNGREAFYELKKIDKNCKVIISSGFTKDENLNQLKKDGLSGFIQKPFNNFELSQLLNNLNSSNKSLS